MAYRQDKATGDIIIDGWEKGIAPSPHLGIANMQAVNTSTEPGEVMCAYAREMYSQTNSTGTGTVEALDASNLLLRTAGGSTNVRAGMWITVSSSTITGLSNGTYYVLQNANGQIQAQLATTYQGTAVTGYGLTGTASFTFVRNVGLPVDYAVEKYGASSYRYYVLDNQGLVWVYDTAIVDTTIARTWVLPNTDLITSATGIAVLNGWVMVAGNNSSPSTNQTFWCKQTVLLQNSWSSFAGGVLQSNAATTNPHKMFVGNQSTMYYTDGNFIGSIFPTSGVPNIFSYCQYTASTTTGTISSLIGGVLPTILTATTRIPAVFFSAGTKPTAITVGTLYYIQYAAGTGTFEVYAASSGGAAIDIETGSSGAQYFNTFGPIYAGSVTSYVWTPQHLTLPFNEVTQSMAELGNILIVGCKSNVVYQWGQANPQADGFIYLPESNVVNIITVNNMGYAFAGNKGNIYVTNGSTASRALKVPDYCSGLVEPYYVWGGAMFLRGRVYFSVQDQFSGHTGQTGGVWSFLPVENYTINGDNAGSGLRLENQNSYGSYNGRASVLIPFHDQAARGPQYFAGWISNAVSSPTYGIDFSDDTPSTAAVIETDIIPIGTFLNKGTIKQVEYKVSTVLNGDTITIKYRTSLDATFAVLDTKVTESTNDLSAYFPANFQTAQWLQLQVTMQPLTSSTASFCRLTELRVR